MDNTWIGLPVAFIDWNISDRLKLRTFSGAALLYDVFGDNSLVLNAVFEYRNSYYRLEEREGARRSVSDSFYQFSVGATYNISGRAYVSAAVGGNFGRELDMRRNSRSAEEYEVDAAPFFPCTRDSPFRGTAARNIPNRAARAAAPIPRYLRSMSNPACPHGTTSLPL